MKGQYQNRIISILLNCIIVRCMAAMKLAMEEIEKEIIIEMMSGKSSWKSSANERERQLSAAGI